MKAAIKTMLPNTTKILLNFFVSIFSPNLKIPNV